MKINKILLVSIMLLAIFTIGAISAAEDANLTDSGENIIQTPDEDIELEDTSSSEDDYIKAEILEDNIKVNDIVNIHIELDENTSGYLHYYLDEPDEDDDVEYYDEGGAYISTAFVPQDFGDHTIFVKYYNGNKPDKTLELPFTCKDYELNVFPDDYLNYDLGYIAFDDDFELRIDAPKNAKGTLKIDFNGNIYTTTNTEEDEKWIYSITIAKEHLAYGQNNVTVTFTPEDKNSLYQTKTIKTIINTTGYVKNPYYIPYNSKTNITLVMPDDAKGKMTVKIDEDTYTVDVNGGKTQFSVPTNDIGPHSLYVDFDGNYKFLPHETYISISGNVIIPKYYWDKEDKIISIEVPQTMNGEVSIVENGEEIANITVINGKGTAKLDLDEGYHYFGIYWYGDGDIEFDNKEAYVISDNPSWNMEVKTDKVLRSYPYLHIENKPGFIDANYQLIIDGKEFKATDNVGGDPSFDATELANGKHNYTLSFLGDGYFKPTSASGSFELDDMVVNFPDEYVLADSTGEKESLSAMLPEDATGTLTFSVNGKTVKTVDLVDEFADYYFDISCEIPQENIKLNQTNTITVKLVDKKYKTITKTAKIFATYELAPNGEVIYGNQMAELYAPYELNVKKITATIDGKNYEVIKDNNDYFFIKTTTDLGIGNHSVVLSYAGDKKFPAHTKTSNIEVIGEIDYVHEYDYTYVYSQLPENVKGNITITINGEEYANVKAAGKVNVSLNNLSWGYYTIKAEYIGDDYDIKGFDDYISITPPFKAPTKLLAGTTDSISINLTGITGRLHVYGDGGFDKEVELVDGFASITLPVLPVGNNWIYVDFYHTYTTEDGDEDYDSYYRSFGIKVVNPITAKDTAIVYSANGNYKVNIKDIDGKAVQSGKVTFYILDGKKQILKKSVNIKNGAATLTYKIAQGVKTYKIKTVFNKASVTKKLTVKHVVSLKALKVKKSAKKITIQANLAKVNGKYLAKKTVTFKFNGKTYKAKTNSKGIAKVTIKSNILKKLKVGKKITYQATYLKDTVKKTVKVKK